MGCLFMLLTVSFDAQSILDLLYSHLASVANAFNVMSKKSLANPYHEAFPLYFLQF